MTDAAIEVTERGFAVRGEMSFATVNRLLAVSQEVFKDKSCLEIDLSQVKRADSAGLALLVEWMARARRGNAGIRFLNMPEQMSAIARMTGVDTLLPASE
jgi:phospholipid transport system transporter-binding protein